MLRQMIVNGKKFVSEANLGLLDFDNHILAKAKITKSIEFVTQIRDMSNHFRKMVEWAIPCTDGNPAHWTTRMKTLDQLEHMIAANPYMKVKVSKSELSNNLKGLQDMLTQAKKESEYSMEYLWKYHEKSARVMNGILQKNINVDYKLLKNYLSNDEYSALY